MYSVAWSTSLSQQEVALGVAALCATPIWICQVVCYVLIQKELAEDQRVNIDEANLIAFLVKLVDLVYPVAELEGIAEQIRYKIQ